MPTQSGLKPQWRGGGSAGSVKVHEGAMKKKQHRSRSDSGGQEQDGTGSTVDNRNPVEVAAGLDRFSAALAKLRADRAESAGVQQQKRVRPSGQQASVIGDDGVHSQSDLATIEQTAHCHKQLNGLNAARDGVLARVAVAEVGLRALDRYDAMQLKAARQPPKAVRDTLDVVCQLLQMPHKVVRVLGLPTASYNDAATVLLGSSDMTERLCQCSKETIPDTALLKLLPVVQDSNFEPSLVKRASPFCAVLCEWCRAVFLLAWANMQTRVKSEEIRFLRLRALRERAYKLSLECQSLWAGVSDDLHTAEATFTGSLEMLAELDKATLAEVKALRSPPAAVQDLFVAVCVLVDCHPALSVEEDLHFTLIQRRGKYWQLARSLLIDASESDNLVSLILSLEPTEVSGKALRTVKPYVLDNKLRPAALTDLSIGVAAIASWLRSVFCLVELLGQADLVTAANEASQKELRIVVRSSVANGQTPLPRDLPVQPVLTPSKLSSQGKRTPVAKSPSTAAAAAQQRRSPSPSVQERRRSNSSPSPHSPNKRSGGATKSPAVRSGAQVKVVHVKAPFDESHADMFAAQPGDGAAQARAAARAARRKQTPAVSVPVKAAAETEPTAVETASKSRLPVPNAKMGKLR